jgi:hypothetical protein
MPYTTRTGNIANRLGDESRITVRFRNAGVQISP